MRLLGYTSDQILAIVKEYKLLEGVRTTAPYKIMLAEANLHLRKREKVRIEGEIEKIRAELANLRKLRSDINQEEQP